MRWSYTPLLIGALSLHAAEGFAYCRTTTCSRTADASAEPCELDEDDCALNGALTFWKGGCVSFSVQKDGSELRGISYEQTFAAAQQAFDAWLSVDCGNGHPGIEVADSGPVSCRRHEYNQSEPNAHIILFRDDEWPDDYDPTALALTTLTHEVNTGEIYDADIEINSFMMRIAADGSGDYQLGAILKHEAGHFFGLDHASDPDTMMYTYYNASSMRSLAADDIEGICAIYPPGAETSSASCEPRHGFSEQCAQNQSGGCTCRVPNPNTQRRRGPAYGWLLVALSWVARRRSSGGNG